MICTWRCLTHLNIFKVVKGLITLTLSLDVLLLMPFLLQAWLHARHEVAINGADLGNYNSLG